MQYQEIFNFKAIGYVESPFKDRFGVPRQSGLVSQIRGRIKFSDDPHLKAALKNINEFSHIWVVFVFHEHGGKTWKPSVRPPRLGGRKKVGVLSSRSPHRPNPIGISAVKIESVNIECEGGPLLEISGLDLIHGTPVLDIKPYLPYADSIPHANAGWANEEIQKYQIEVDPICLDKIEIEDHVLAVIKEVLEIDPRASHQKRENPIGSKNSIGLNYGIEIMGLEVKYQITEFGLKIIDLFYPEKNRK